MFRLLLVFICFLAPLHARADWHDLSEIHLNTAHTLREGELQMGLFAPLSVGIIDDFQLSIHPLLLLLGQPSLGMRWRFYQDGGTALALNLTGAWSFTEKESVRIGNSGREREGFPGSIQLTETTSFSFGKHVMLSFGAGLALDWIGEKPSEFMAEVHASTQVLITEEHLLMLQLMGFIPFQSQLRLLRPSAQLLYGWAVSSHVHLAFGVGMGQWLWKNDLGERTELLFYPVLDAWFLF